jgi:aspartyl-tRNA(Asn)/glutamyl-tRNA(Gln) amidotransferase subunit B
MDYHIVIGLEVHVQLLTESKLFCGCSTKFGAPPNSQTCPICIGMPGVLPVMNRRAFELALRTAIALNCDISEFTKWDRKNYYYPDLPKNYQISQYDLPFSHDGFINISLADDGSEKRIGIIRAHLEEDAGKLLHSETGPGDSRVDLNRAGTPLLEIVSQPDMSSPAEAARYLTELRLLLRYLEVSDCNMQEGSLRCDANVNIHVRHHDEFIATPLVEVKNMNSFRAVERAMAYEAQRQFDEFQANFGSRWQLIPNSGASFLGHRTVLQIGELRDGRLAKVAKATAGWDDPRGATVIQRRKEEASDYRYFPEPDLVPVAVSDNWIQAVRDSIGELPADRRNRLKIQHFISDYDAGVIIEQGKSFADYFEDVARACESPKMAANWCQQEVLRTLNDRKISIEQFPVSAVELGSLIARVVAGQINNHSAREVFGEMLATGKPADAIIKAKGMQQISNEDELRQIVISVLDSNPKILDDYKKGKKRDQVEGFARGQVMKQTRGQANSSLVERLVKEELGKRAGEG